MDGILGTWDLDLCSLPPVLCPSDVARSTSCELLAASSLLEAQVIIVMSTSIGRLGPLSAVIERAASAQPLVGKLGVLLWVFLLGFGGG